MKTYFYGLD